MNYGHGVVIGFVLFALYILYFVYQSFNQRIELVSEDYYAREVAFQGRIDASNNALAMDESASVSRTDKALKIELPIIHRNASGSVFIFRPSDDRLDFSVPFTAQDSGKVEIPLSRFSSGRYEVQITWEHERKTYYLKKDIFI